MDKQIKEDWLEALRSGEYQQGTGFLEKDGCNCCLGVLCRVLEIEGEGESMAGETVYFDGYCATLSDRLLLTAQISDDLAMELAAMNDGGTTFEQIADYIEAEL